MLWISEYPSHWAKIHPDKPAFVVGTRITTYAQLDEGSDALNAHWQAVGLKPGDRVGYLGRNSDLFYMAFFACARGGFVFTPINWRLAAPEITFILDDSSARILIADREFLPLAEHYHRQEGRPLTVIGSEDGNGCLRALVERKNRASSRYQNAFHAPFLQLYTSGTTGRPKGALLCHGGLSLARQFDLVSTNFDLFANDDIVLAAVPNFHVAGIGLVTMTLRAGATCVHTSDSSPGNLITLCNEHSVTRVFMVPTLIRAVLDELRRTQTRPPRLRALYYGASPMSEAMLAEVVATFGCRLTQLFGMTETSGSATFLPSVDHDPSRPHLMRSVGRPFLNIGIEIRRPDMIACEVREPGEIWVKTETRMLEYVNNPIATSVALVDGWYRTGDGGYLDADGYLYLTDRIRDMILSGGENVYPIEVENALREHPAIQEVAVIGLADEFWGEKVAAILEWRAGQSASAEELIAFARARIARFKCPRVLYVSPSLPRTASGKVQRSAAKSNIAQYRQLLR